MDTIETIAVLGSGVMGGAIAAHAANAGAKVILLDIVPQGAENRNALAQNAVARMLKQQPSAFLSPARAERITCGNLEDHLHLLAEADWIIEAVVEKKEVKQDVYRKVDAVRKKGAVISSNTSTLPLNELMEGLPAHIAEDFMIAHFFNPPRFMRLLEVLKGENTREASYERVKTFADIRLGKEIVPVKDTPGFIANRIGVYWMTLAFNEALKRGMAVEEADAVLGRPIGVPKTGVFGLYDLIGLDLMPLIARSMLHSLPESDPFRALETEPELLKKLIAEGYTGRKGKGGFYRIRKEGDKKIRETLDLATGGYRAEAKPALASAKARSIGELLNAGDAGGDYAWAVMSGTILYAASLIPQIAEDIHAVDTAMKTGYNWGFGPFELLDAIGTGEFIARLEREGRALPPLLQAAGGKPLYRDGAQGREFLTLSGEYAIVPRAKGALMLSDTKRGRNPVLKNDSAALWDMGDGVACFEFTTKMNAVDDGLLDLLEQSVEKAEKDFAGLVIGHDGDLFSAGANLQYFLDRAESGAWSEIEARIKRGQEVFFRLKTARVPSVAALSGMALGGGCEITLHTSAVQAYAESYPGLVEVGVGLIPAWGGCKEMLLRFKEAETPFKLILSAHKAASSDEAASMRVLNEKSGVSMNRARLLADAKERCAALAGGYRKAAPATLALPSGTRAQLEAQLKEQEGALPPHTLALGRILIRVLSADGAESVGEQALYDLEREGFMEAIRTKESQARIAHMLKTGKPLPN